MSCPTLQNRRPTSTPQLSKGSLSCVSNAELTDEADRPGISRTARAVHQFHFLLRRELSLRSPQAIVLGCECQLGRGDLRGESVLIKNLRARALGKEPLTLLSGLDVDDV